MLLVSRSEWAPTWRVDVGAALKAHGVALFLPACPRPLSGATPKVADPTDAPVGQREGAGGLRNPWPRISRK